MGFCYSFIRGRASAGGQFRKIQEGWTSQGSLSASGCSVSRSPVPTQIVRNQKSPSSMCPAVPLRGSKYKDQSQRGDGGVLCRRQKNLARGAGGVTCCDAAVPSVRRSALQMRRPIRAGVCRARAVLTSSSIASGKRRILATRSQRYGGARRPPSFPPPPRVGP